MTEFNFKALSFGAGVQSTAIALLIKHNPELLIKVVGHLPDKAYFADTGAEPMSVYQHLKMMQGIFPIPLDIVSNGSILNASRHEDGKKVNFVPLFTEHGGMLNRSCTAEFKVLPVRRKLTTDYKERFGKLPKGKGKVAMWLGISMDEIIRMKPSSLQYMKNVYPLIDLSWDRTDCFNYCVSHGIHPPKSRCYFCPYTADWHTIRRNKPDEWQLAVEYDESHRDLSEYGVKHKCYVHRSRQPLKDAVQNQGDLFEGFFNECEGICGT